MNTCLFFPYYDIHMPFPVPDHTLTKTYMTPSTMPLFRTRCFKLWHEARRFACNPDCPGCGICYFVTFLMAESVKPPMSQLRAIICALVCHSGIESYVLQANLFVGMCMRLQKIIWHFVCGRRVRSLWDMYFLVLLLYHVSLRCVEYFRIHMTLRGQTKHSEKWRGVRE